MVTVVVNAVTSMSDTPVDVGEFCGKMWRMDLFADFKSECDRVDSEFSLPCSFYNTAVRLRFTGHIRQTERRGHDHSSRG